MQLHKNKTGVKGDTVEDRFQELLNECSDAHGFKHISVDGVYDDETNTFHEDVKTYSILYTLGRYAEIETDMKKFAQELYPLYEQGDIDGFYYQCSAVTKMINQGKLTKKQMKKSGSIASSLDMLVSLDEDYCKFLVNKFLSKDEFIDLDDKLRSLKI
jgi:hypothetical protein